jgi:hypothetical protein
MRPSVSTDDRLLNWPPPDGELIGFDSTGAYIASRRGHTGPLIAMAKR